MLDDFKPVIKDRRDVEVTGKGFSCGPAAIRYSDDGDIGDIFKVRHMPGTYDVTRTYNTNTECAVSHAYSSSTAALRPA
jgi:hypothetical protein